MGHFGRFGYGPGPMGYGVGMIPHILSMLVCLIIFVIAVIILVRLIRNKGPLHLHHMGYASRHIGAALEILNERYAKGEISDEEYLKKKAEINKI